MGSKNSTVELLEDRAVVHDARRSQLKLRPYEKELGRWSAVECTTLGRGVGSMVLTSLRVIWEACRKRRGNSSIGLRLVQCVQYNTVDSDRYGRTRACCLSLKPGAVQYTLAFSVAGSAGLALFHVLNEHVRRFKATAPLRDVMCRDPQVAHKCRLALQSGEKVAHVVPRVDWLPLSGLPRPGRVCLTQFRLVWLGPAPRSSVSVPLFQIAQVSVRVIGDARVVVVDTKDSAGRFRLALRSLMVRTDHLARLICRMMPEPRASVPLVKLDGVVRHQKGRFVVVNEAVKSPSEVQHLSSEEPRCVICLEAQASVVLEPCGHTCLCIACVGVSACPLCRANVQYDSKYVQGLLAKVVAVMGLQFVVNAVIVFPADCYANHAGNTILAELYWFLSHMSLLFYLIFLAPYALLFVDAESGNSKAQSGWRRSAWFKALFWTVVVCVLVLVAAGLLVLVLGRYYILDPADPSRMIMMQLGFKEYCITVVMWFGVFFVVVYCPVGFVVLPLHCILKYIDRPVSIAAQDYVNQKQALAEKAGALRSLGEGLRDRTKRVNNLKGVRGWWMQSRNRALIERYRASTCLLRSRAEQLEECFFYKPVSQIKAVCWLCLGIVCIVMSSLWTLHIVEVGILPGLLKKPPRIYLWDRMLIFGSQSNIFIIEFLIYLFFYSFVFIATTAGFHKTGMRTPYGIHMSPLRKEGTHVNQILIFTMTLCFTGTGLNMFVWILCPQWAAESVLHKLFANYKTNGFYEVVFNNYAPALWVTAGIELASIIYFSIRPRDRFMFPLETPEDVKRTEDMAASWRTANAPLTQQARGPRTGLRDLGQKIQDKEADVVNRAKGAVPMGMRAGMKMA